MPPVKVVCALIWNQPRTRMLIARRPPGKRLAGLWEFPGGKVDPGETVTEALHRELQEELGCQVETLHTLADIEHSYPWGIIALTPVVCLLRKDSPQPQALEHTDLKWVTWADLPGYDLAPADLPLLTLYRPE